MSECDNKTSRVSKKLQGVILLNTQSHSTTLHTHNYYNKSVELLTIVFKINIYENLCNYQNCIAETIQ